MAITAANVSAGDTILATDHNSVVTDLNSLDGSIVSLSDSTPEDVGTAAAGTGTDASRDDHVHGFLFPNSFTFSNTSQSIGTGATYTLQVALGSSDFDLAIVHANGAGNTTKGGLMLVTTSDSDATVIENTSSATCVTRARTLSAYLTNGNYTQAGSYTIRINDIRLNGSNLEIDFYNSSGSTYTLHVQGTAFVFKGDVN